MANIGFLVILGLSCFALTESTKTIDSHLSSADIERLNNVFSEGLDSDDIQSIYYGALHIKDLQKKHSATCPKVIQLHKNSKLNDFEKNFYLINIFKKLACPNPIDDSIQTAISLLRNTIRSPVWNTHSMLLRNLVQRAEPLADWIEGAFAQADEVSGKMLHFEGGLSITALVLNGAFRLTNASKKPAPLSEEQTHKFVAYLLSRRSVQIPKGAHVLIDALTLISADKKIAPDSAQLLQQL